MTVTADQVLDHALAQKGDRYVFGAEASPLDPDPDAFDCSELVEWSCAEAHVAPKVPDGAFYQWKHSRGITVAQGIATRGALLFHGDGTGVGRDAITHVAFSLGDGTTIEARGKRYGVGTWAAPGRFQFAGLIPGVTYGPAGTVRPPNQGGGLILRKGAKGQAVSFLQGMLNITRPLHKGPALITDGDFGGQTEAAVKAFQKFARSMQQVAGEKDERKLVDVDGVAGPQTLDGLAFWVPAILGQR